MSVSTIPPQVPRVLGPPQRYAALSCVHRPWEEGPQLSSDTQWGPWPFRFQELQLPRAVAPVSTMFHSHCVGVKPPWVFGRVRTMVPGGVGGEVLFPLFLLLRVLMLLAFQFYPSENLLESHTDIYLSANKTWSCCKYKVKFSQPHTSEITPTTLAYTLSNTGWKY